MGEQFKSLHPVKYYRDYIANNFRPDGRKLNEFRPAVLNVGTIDTADGSTIAKIGETTVVCGIKAELCAPKSDKPNEGFLLPNIELSPLCSPKFRPGPPSDQSQVSTQLLDDIIKNAKCIDLKELCIYPDKLVWCLYADIICLNFDGGLMDACVAALLAALKTVKLPTVDYDPALDNKLVNMNERKALMVYSNPICTTFAIFDDKVLLTDPTDEEESLCSGILNIILEGETLYEVHKPGGSPLTDEELFGCIEMSKTRSKNILKLIRTALKDVT